MITNCSKNKFGQSLLLTSLTLFVLNGVGSIRLNAQEDSMEKSTRLALVEPKAALGSLGSRGQKLDKIVQPVTTVSKFIGGQEERNRGSGFVIGKHFFTVYHNLTTSFPSLRLSSTTFIDGMSVKRPVFLSRQHDVAVFELPEKLCSQYCNELVLDSASTFIPAARVYWLRKYQEEVVLKEASILGNVAFGDVEKFIQKTCTKNSVVLIDEPFRPGSSGSPIMDAKSGKIIGIIQGSVDKNGQEKGYFKPINCVLPLFKRSHLDHSVAKL